MHDVLFFEDSTMWMHVILIITIRIYQLIATFLSKAIDIFT